MNLPTKITFSRIIATVVLIIALFVLSVIPDLSTPELGNTRINLIFLVVFVFFVIASYTDHLDGKLFIDHCRNRFAANEVLEKYNLPPIEDDKLIDEDFLEEEISKYEAEHPEILEERRKERENNE